MRDNETIQEIKRRFKDDVKNRRFKKIADLIGVNRGTLYGVLKGRWTSNKVRVALGLACLVREVEPCPCGSIHHRRCEKGKGILRRVKSSNPRKLKFVQKIIVPFLIEKLKQKY